MAKIKPFKALRPIESKVYEVSTKPYESLNTQEIRGELEDNFYSFINVVRPDINVSKDFEEEDELIYDQARFNLNRLLKENVLIQDNKPSFYVYEQVIQGRSRTCILGLSSVEDYNSQLIRKHEMTLPKKEEKIVSYLRRVEIQPAPVFLTYPKCEAISDCLEKFKCEDTLLYNFTTSSGNLHKVWQVVDSESVNTVISLFEHEVDALYIADGHHRAASASRWAKLRQSVNPSHTGEEGYNYLFSVYWADDQVDVIGYNRLVKDLNGLSHSDYLERVAVFFEVRGVAEAPTVLEEGHIGMYLKDKWFELKPKNGFFNPDNVIDRLDVAVLQANLLDPILGINDPRKDKRIDFIGGRKDFRYLESYVMDGSYEVAFALSAVSMESFFSIADSNGIMPPKSTWFEPKLRTGVIIRSMND